jgi:hypothetical protein
MSARSFCRLLGRCVSSNTAHRFPRACRGVGAALSAAEVERFDVAHAEMLAASVPDRFTVLHRIDAHVLKPASITSWGTERCTGSPQCQHEGSGSTGVARVQGKGKEGPLND